MEQQPRQRKAPSPHSKCSFQTSLPHAGLSWRLLGAPGLTLGSCQESCRGSSLPPTPFSPRSSSISSLSGVPYKPLFSVLQLVSTHRALPLWASLAAVTTPSSQASPHWFPRKGGGGSVASKPPEVRLWMNSPPSQIAPITIFLLLPFYPRDTCFSSIHTRISHTAEPSQVGLSHLLMIFHYLMLFPTF